MMSYNKDEYSFNEKLFSELKLIASTSYCDVYDTTNICFQIFVQVVPLYSNKNLGTTLDVCFISFTKLKEIVTYLKQRGSFCQNKFMELIYENIEKMSLQLAAYLKELGIYSFEEYISEVVEDDFVEEWYNLYSAESSNDINTSDRNWIAYDWMVFFIRIYYGKFLPHTSGITYTDIEKNKYIFEELFSKVVEEFLLNPIDMRFCNMLRDINMKKCLPRNVLFKFSEGILNKILAFGPVANMYNVYMMQELLISQHTSAILMDTLSEVLKNVNIYYLDKIKLTSSYQLNWKYVLMIFSIFVKNFSDGNEIHNYIQLSLERAFEKKGDFDQFVKTIIFTRQVCFENPERFLTYDEWYGKTFGLDTKFSTGNNVVHFTFFINSFMSMIDYEPKYCLESHIKRSLQIPRKCQSLMKKYKDVCKIQLQYITQSPTLNINNVVIPVRIILDNSLLDLTLSWPIVYIISENEPEVFHSMVSIILTDSKYSTIKDKLLGDPLILKKIPQCQLEMQNLPHEDYVL